MPSVEAQESPDSMTRPAAASWRDLTPRGPRAAARSAAISSLAAAMRISGRMNALLARPRVQVVILHHLFPDEEQPFRSLLKSLSRQHTFIGFGEAVRRAERGNSDPGGIDRPYIAFTFDDGLKHCIRAGAVLREFGATACFFICPAIIGETDPRRIEAFCKRLEIPPVEFATWDDLEALRDAGHEVGGHTMTHPNLATLSRHEVSAEIGGCYDAIKSRLGGVEHFAWTFGGFHHMTPEAAHCVYQTGFLTCASGVRGCHPPHPPHVPSAAHSPNVQRDRVAPLCIRRDQIIAGAPPGHAQYFL